MKMRGCQTQLKYLIIAVYINAICMVLMIVRLTILKDARCMVKNATAKTHLNVRFIAQMGMGRASMKRIQQRAQKRAQAQMGMVTMDLVALTHLQGTHKPLHLKTPAS